jgi:hypothetical protein
VSFSLAKILEGLGVTSSEVNRVQLGPGVVGNTTTALICSVIASAAQAYFLHDQPAVMFGAMAVTVILLLVYMFGTWRFAERHPDLALMGGADLLQLRRMEMAAKHPEIMIDSTPIIAPTLPAPVTSEIPGGESV